MDGGLPTMPDVEITWTVSHRRRLQHGEDPHADGTCDLDHLLWAWEEGDRHVTSDSSNQRHLKVGLAGVSACPTPVDVVQLVRDALVSQRTTTDDTSDTEQRAGDDHHAVIAREPKHHAEQDEQPSCSAGDDAKQPHVQASAVDVSAELWVVAGNEPWR